jgi:hypothetical protein
MTLTPSKVNQGLPAPAANAWPVSIPAPPTITEKQDQPASTNATWTSATGTNTAVTVATTGYGTATVSIQVPSTVTAGVITIEVSDDAGTTYYPAGAVRVDNALQENAVSLASGGAQLNRMWAVSVDAMTQVRARLSTVITGTGNVVVRVGVVAGGIAPFVSSVMRKDVGRQQVFLQWAQAAGTASVESALTNFSIGTRNATALTAASSYTVSTGKTLRIQAVTAYLQLTAVALTQGFFRIRQAASVANTSPVIWGTTLGIEAATGASGTLREQSFAIPDGLEVPAGQQITFTWLTFANTTSLGLTIVGYEY